VGSGRNATYLGAALAGICTNTVFGFIRAYILIALFAVRPILGGYGSRMRSGTPSSHGG